MKFFRENVITFLARIAVVGFGLLQMVILTRCLNTSQFGFYIILTLIPGVMFQLINMGIDQTIMYFAGRRVYPDKVVASNAIFFAVVAGGVAGGLLLIASHFFPMHEIQSQYGLMVMAALLAPLFFINFGVSAFLIAKGRINQFNAVNLVNYGSVLVLQFIFLVIMGARRQGLSMAFLGFFLGMSLTAVMVVVLMKDDIAFTRPDKQFFKDFVSFGFTVYLSNLFTQLIYRVDILLIGFMLTSSAVGYYSVSVRLVEKLWMLSASLQVTLLPKVAGAGSKAKEREYTSRVCRNVFLFSLLGAPTLAVFSWLAIPILFGSVYLRSLNPLLILLPGIVGLSINKVLAIDFLSKGKPIYATAITFITLVLNIVLNVIFIPRFDIEGAALASTISYLFSTAAFLWAAITRFDFNARELLVVQRSDLEYYRIWISSTFGRLRGFTPGAKISDD